MEKLTEWDELQEAFNKVNLDEEVFSFRNGKLINESESYMKMKAILNCPEMQKSHAYLYNLDPEQLDEDEIENISKLYDLGCRRGFIKPDDADDCEPKDEVPAEVPAQVPPAVPACNAPSMFKAKIPCWTILYSAVDKNGDIKTGECFSNAVNPRSAKADCYGKLTRCGYSSISILAIEAGDPDNCGSEECCEVPDEGNVEIRVTEDDKLAKVPSNGNAQLNGHVREAEEDAKDEDVSERDAKKKDPVDEAEVNEAGNAMFEKAFDQLLFRIDDCREIMQMYDADSDTADHAYKALQAAYTKCLELADDPADLDELNKTMANEGFVINDAGIIISDGEDSFPMTESGNPYLAGMKMTDVKNASASKTKVNEDDEDESSDDDSDDSDDSSADDSSDDETSSEDSEDDSEPKESDDEAADDAEEDSSDDSDAADDSSEDSEDEDSSSDDKSEDNTSENDSDDKSDDETSDETDGDESDEKDSEEDDADDSDETSDDEASDDSNDDSEEDDSEKKKDLTDEEKTEMKGEYKKVFRNVMSKCKFEDKCFDDLSIKEKVKFFQKLNADWKKNDPQDFMSDKEIEQLNKVVIKKA